MKILADTAAGACVLLFLASTLGKLDRWTQWAALTDRIAGPHMFRWTLRLAVPAIEAALVVLIVVSPTVGLAGGAIVLASLSVAVYFLSQEQGIAGRDCNCFGAIAPATIGLRLAGRNVVLATLVAGFWLLARHENLQALSVPELFVIVLTGTIGLMLAQFRRLQLGRRRADSHSPPNPQTQT